MRKRSRFLAYLVAAGLGSQPAVAQMSAPPIPSALPGITKISAANAAGVLKYCNENGLVSGVSVDALMASSVTRADQTSVDYIVGSSGQILGDAGKNFSISRAPGYVQSQACAMVLERAKAFNPQH
jgi:hypothetical protein